MYIVGYLHHLGTTHLSKRILAISALVHTVCPSAYSTGQFGRRSQYMIGTLFDNMQISVSFYLQQEVQVYFFQVVSTTLVRSNHNCYCVEIANCACAMGMSKQSRQTPGSPENCSEMSVKSVKFWQWLCPILLSWHDTEFIQIL